MKEILNKDITVTHSGAINVIQTDRGFTIHVGKEGGAIKLSGQKGNLGGATWTTDKHIVFPIQYDVLHSYYFRSFFYTEDGTFFEANFGTFPYVPARVSYPLTFFDLENVFMKRTPGMLKNMMHGSVIKPEDVVAMALEIPESSSECILYFDFPYLSDCEESGLLDAPCQMDKFGQWTMKDWKGKVHSEEELGEVLEHARYGKLQEFPQQVSKYGGDLSKKVQGTGFFRIHKEGGTYWFCDPEGYMFYSKGMDAVTPIKGSSAIYGLENLLEEIPPQDGIYAEAWDKGSVPIWGYNERVSMHAVNLMRIFGADWYQAWEDITKRRFTSLGINTVAAFSSTDFARNQKIPYTISNEFPTTKETLFRSMPDVFSKEYRDNARECAQYLLPYKDDPYMLGYFMRNEPEWAFGVYNIAGIMLEKNIDFVSKDIFIADMVKKYYTIDKLNTAWNLKLSSFSELKKPIEKAWLLSEDAKLDLENFTRRLIREYIRVPAEAFRAVDPNHLNLGLRWGWISTEDLIEGCEYCDVFSINCYKEVPNKDELDRLHAITNLPILIGEFQVGSLDVGNAANGMFGVLNQTERGKFYRYYMEQTASFPYMIGAHYFKLNDQPVIPPDFGENLNVGMVSVTCREYEDMTDVMRIANARLDAIHAGELAPTQERSILVPKEGF